MVKMISLGSLCGGNIERTERQIFALMICGTAFAEKGAGFSSENTNDQHDKPHDL